MKRSKTVIPFPTESECEDVDEDGLDLSEFTVKKEEVVDFDMVPGLKDKVRRGLCFYAERY